MNKALLIILTITATSKQTDVDKQIKELEKQKDDVLKEINEAIGDSVKSLNMTNDTDFSEAQGYLQQLAEQMKHLNETADQKEEEDGLKEIVDLIDDGNKLENSSQNFSALRRFGTVYSSHNKEIRVKIMDLMKLLSQKQLSSIEKKHWKPDKNRPDLEKKLQAWLKKRREELEKKRQRKEMYKTGEKCPDFGTRSKKRKRFRRTEVNETRKSNDNKKKRKRKRHKKKKGSKSRTYPCCRKCCKKSYMGCL